MSPHQLLQQGGLAVQEIGRVRRARRCAGEVMAVIDVAVGRREDQQAVAQPAGLLRSWVISTTVRPASRVAARV